MNDISLDFFLSKEFFCYEFHSPVLKTYLQKRPHMALILLKDELTSFMLSDKGKQNFLP